MIATLFAIDRASLIIAPCSEYGSAQNNDDGPNNNYCAARKGLIVAGIEWLADVKPEVWTALATVAIAAFTLTLWLSTDGMLRATNESINLARAEFLSTHRPRMRLKHTWFTDQTDWRLNGPLEINLDFVNIGNTDARITWINYQSLILPAGQRLPQRPPYDEPVPDGSIRITRFRSDAVLPSGVTLARPVCDGILNLQEVHSILWGTHWLYLIGTIEYWHGAGLRQTAFCRRFTYNNYPPLPEDMGRFEKECDPDYEYED